MNKEFLEMIRCPHCMQNQTKEGQGKFEFYQETWLICDDCGRKYPIIDDIPVLLLDEAEKWMGVTKENLPNSPTKE